MIKIILMCRNISHTRVQTNYFLLLGKRNYLQTFHLQIIYVYPFKYVPTND